MNKRAITQLKAYFLMINVVLAVVAFSWLVSGVKIEPLNLLPPIRETLGPPAFSLDQPIDVDTQTMMEEILLGKSHSPLPIKKPPIDVKTAIQLTTSSNVVSIPADVNLYTPRSSTRIGKLISEKGKFYEVGANGGLGNEVLIPEGVDPTTFESIGGPATKCTGPFCFTQNIFSSVIMENLISAAMIGGIGALVGGFVGGNGAIAGFFAGFGGVTAFQIMKDPKAYKFLGGKTIEGFLGKEGLGFSPGIIGIGVAATIFILMYKDTEQEVVEFNCMPYQPPTGGDDCQLCNDYEECGEYTCKSLGQACELLNQGSGDEMCDWVNPHDVNSPKIQMSDVLKGYKWTPDTSVRPPATGAVIAQENNGCVKAFTALEFTIATDEPAQCKIDYDITTGFDEMSYFIGGNNLFSYNHTEKMSLPSPSSLEQEFGPEIENDGTYTLYVRCKDANGNFNQDLYSVRFCVEEGPDTTPPTIVNLNVPSNTPVSYNTSELYLEVYVNEPAECKWSRENRDYEQMETQMSCDTSLGQINPENLFTCRTTLTGIKDRQDNEYYFRCRDVSEKLNVNEESSLYNVIGTQPLNILYIKPVNETIKDSTSTIAVTLEVKTDSGYENGHGFCNYYNDADNNPPVNDEDYLQFSETDSNMHTQRQDLVTGDYVYYIKCFDLGGNAAYDSTSFSVETDESPPIIVRAYKESGQLKIMTHEEAECSYSHTDCNFENADGIQMESFDNEAHSAEWLITKNYYVRCNDEYNNQPNPNTCSVIVRPFKFIDKSNVVEL